MSPLLQSILQIESESYKCDEMSQFLFAHAKSMGMSVSEDETGNLYIVKGKADTYPCAVAHMDTVHKITGHGIGIITVGHRVTGLNCVTMEQTGIGGDDKCGIYAALQCLERLPACKAAFFVDEEVGCQGSSRAELEFFKDCRFILQADRRGGGDWVSDISGYLGSKEFQKAVKPFLKRHGYKPCSGMMSDVMELRDNKVGVSAANMSAGYHNPHFANEFIDLKQLDNCIEMMVAISTHLTEPFPFVCERAAHTQFEQWHGFSKTGSKMTRTYPSHPKGRPSLLDEQDWFYEQNMKQKIIEENGSLLTGWPDEEGTRPPLFKEEYCLNCQDVHILANLIDIGQGALVCRDCHEEIYGSKK